jgi:hypothetical protein
MLFLFPIFRQKFAMDHFAYLHLIHNHVKRYNVYSVKIWHTKLYFFLQYIYFLRKYFFSKSIEISIFSFFFYFLKLRLNLFFVLDFFFLDFFTIISKKFIYILFFNFFLLLFFNFSFLSKKKLIFEENIFHKHKFFGLRSFRIFEVFKEDTNIYFYSSEFFSFFQIPSNKVLIFSFFSSSFNLFTDIFCFFFFNLSCHYIFFIFYNAFINYSLWFSFELRNFFIVSFNVVLKSFNYSYRLFLEEVVFLFSNLFFWIVFFPNLFF